MQDKVLSHLNEDGELQMVSIADKTVSKRRAKASGEVTFPEDIYTQIRAVQGITKKGSITEIAHIAGIMAAKRTDELIPLCHQLPLDKISLDFVFNDCSNSIIVTASTEVTHKTGVEMEALTAVSIACLTIYDMTKALSHEIVISSVRLLEKTGGKSDFRVTKG